MWMMGKDSRGGYVYFVSQGVTDKIKIGYTENDPFKRKASLQTGNGDQLFVRCWLYGKRSLMKTWEERYHRELRKEHLHGEWFQGDQTNHEMDIITEEWQGGGEPPESRDQYVYFPYMKPRELLAQWLDDSYHRAWIRSGLERTRGRYPGFDQMLMQMRQTFASLGPETVARDYQRLADWIEISSDIENVEMTTYQDQVPMSLDRPSLKEVNELDEILGNARSNPI
jgi:hypothetical protein